MRTLKLLTGIAAAFGRFPAIRHKSWRERRLPKPRLALAEHWGPPKVELGFHSYMLLWMAFMVIVTMVPTILMMILLV